MLKGNTIGEFISQKPSFFPGNKSKQNVYTRIYCHLLLSVTAHFAFKGRCRTVLTSVTSVGPVQDTRNWGKSVPLGPWGVCTSRKSDVLQQHELLICHHYGKDHWHIE